MQDLVAVVGREHVEPLRARRVIELSFHPRRVVSFVFQIMSEPDVSACLSLVARLQNVKREKQLAASAPPRGHLERRPRRAGLAAATHLGLSATSEQDHAEQSSGD
jgi:hypothetical protein